MQKRQYDNKCKNFFEKASQMGVGLEFDPEQFDATPWSRLIKFSMVYLK